MLLLPGATMACLTPRRTHSSTSVAQKVTATSPPRRGSGASSTSATTSIVAPVLVEVWSDVICPWCYIGKRRFETALARLSERGITDIEVVYRAYQLDPGAPVDSTTPALEGYARKFGGHERAVEITNHVTAIAAAEGLEFRMDRALRANTLGAHRGLRMVLVREGTLAQARAKENLMRAYFTDGENVGDPAVVARCCAVGDIREVEVVERLAAGGYVDEFEADITGAIEHDITAVPTFVVDRRFAIPGAQDVEVFERVLTKLAARE